MLLFPVPSWATSTVAPPGLAVAWLLMMQIKLIARTEPKGTPTTGHPKQNPDWMDKKDTVDSQAQARSRTGLSPEFVWRFPIRKEEGNSSQEGWDAGWGYSYWDSRFRLHLPVFCAVVRAYLLYSVLKHF